MFNIDILKLEKLFLSEIPVVFNFKQADISELLTGKLMGNSGLKSHQYLSGAKSTAVVLKCDTMWSKMHQRINPIDRKLKIKIYLIWGKNDLEEELVDYEFEEVHDE